MVPSAATDERLDLEQAAPPPGQGAQAPPLIRLCAATVATPGARHCRFRPAMAVAALVLLPQTDVDLTGYGRATAANRQSQLFGHTTDS